MKAMSHKLQRIADQVKDVIAQSFCGGRLSDPRLQNITITHVKLSADLMNANVYFLVDKDSVDNVLKGLDSASGFLRKEIATKINMRCVPALRFFYDESVEEGSRIEQLLNKLN